MKKETPKVTESVCLAHALSVLALHQKEFSKDEERRITEAGDLILKVHRSPLELAPIASALIMRGVASFVTQESENDLKVMGADYIKAVLRKAKESIEISSPDDIAKNLGLWFVSLINIHIFSLCIDKEDIIERVGKQRPIEFENFSPFEIMYIGWMLHVIALGDFFSILPAQVFQLPSILKIAEEWVSLEAEIYPELRRALDA